MFWIGLVFCEGLKSGPLAILRDGQTVVSRHSDGLLRLWKFSARGTVNIAGHRGLVTGEAFAGRTGLIVSTGWAEWAGSSGCIRFWDAESADAVAAWGVPGQIARSLAVAPDGGVRAAAIAPRRPPYACRLPWSRGKGRSRALEPVTHQRGDLPTRFDRTGGSVHFGTGSASADVPQRSKLLFGPNGVAARSD